MGYGTEDAVPALVARPCRIVRLAAVRYDALLQELAIAGDRLRPQYGPDAGASVAIAPTGDRRCQVLWLISQYYTAS